MAEIVLYTDSNSGGLHAHLYQSTADFKQLRLIGVTNGVDDHGDTWNDKVSSLVIDRCGERIKRQIYLSLVG